MEFKHRIIIKYPRDISVGYLILCPEDFETNLIYKIISIQKQKKQYEEDNCVYIFTTENKGKIYRTIFSSDEPVKILRCLNERCYNSCIGGCKMFLS